MNYITETHPAVEAIIGSNKLDDETKLLAVAELQRLDEDGKIGTLFFDGHANNVDRLFEWDYSELGSAFWADIQDKTGVPKQRTC